MLKGSNRRINRSRPSTEGPSWSRGAPAWQPCCKYAKLHAPLARPPLFGVRGGTRQNNPPVVSNHLRHPLQNLRKPAPPSPSPGPAPPSPSPGPPPPSPSTQTRFASPPPSSPHRGGLHTASPLPQVAYQSLMPSHAVCDSPRARGSPPQVGGVPTPATPGVWAVSHSDLDRAHAEHAHESGPRSSFELVTDVTFLWSYPAKSAFVTGTFSNWETTVPMTLNQAPEGPLWVLSKALPPGDYQYKCTFALRPQVLALSTWLRFPFRVAFPLASA